MEIIKGENFRSLVSENIFYCNTHQVNNFFINCDKNKPFILISHNSDAIITDNPQKRNFMESHEQANFNLMPENCIKWFGQNVNVKHFKVESLPLGLENSDTTFASNKISLMKDKLKESKEYINYVYMNFNIENNLTERLPLYNMFKDYNFVTTENYKNGHNFSSYINNVHRHKFVLCPEGNGIDTHRTWEALYIGSIPIEKRNINNSFYSDLPICFVDDWSEITEDFLINEFNRIKTKTWNLEKLDFNYWKNKIINYNE